VSGKGSEEWQLFVLHALWLPDSARTGIWAEDSKAPTPPRKPGRQPRIQLHPFAAPPPVLIEFLGRDTRRSAMVSVGLPTRASCPLSSPQLVRDEVDATGAVSVRPWQIPVIDLDAGALIDLMRRLPDVPAAAGASVLHLHELGKFAADLVRRGRVLPTVDYAEGSHDVSTSVDKSAPQARWRPLLTGSDVAWARELASVTPASLTAAGTGEKLETFAKAFDYLVDATARAEMGTLRPSLRHADSAAKAWLKALTGDEPGFTADPRAAATLQAALDHWQRDAVAGPVRACFRLVEPLQDDADAWNVQFALQATDEPSLVVDAQAIWRGRRALPALSGQVAAPQETLLAELGKASRVFPEIDTALRVARPTGLPVDTAGAHRFLSVVGPALATAGFGVQLPGWWRKPSARLGLRLTATTPAQPGRVAMSANSLSVAAVAEFRHELAIGGDVLTDHELAQLADLKQPLVRLRGQWVELDPRRLAAGMKLIGHTRIAPVVEMLKFALGFEQTVDDLPVEGVNATGWLGELLDEHRDERLAPVAPPTSFVGTLRPYQARGLGWLDFLQRAGIGGVLADDMGLGKTVQLLALLAHNSDRRPSLLICPMSLVGNWQREAAKFTPELRVHVHHGAERARGAAFDQAVGAADLVVTTYALAARDATELRKISWARVVVDEAQAIKNAATRQSTAIRSLPADIRIAVTGTPVENRLADLWSILDFANPGMLGSAASFRKQYAEPIERHGDETAADRLRRFTAPFILRRLKTDRSIIADLPEKLEMDVFCNLTREQAGLYRAVVDEMVERIESAEGIERRGLVLATMTRLKQICNHPAHFLRDGSALGARSGKLERLDEIVDEALAAGERVLLFTQFAEFGALLRGHLAGRVGREVLFLHGGVPKAARDDMVARFQSEEAGSPPLFVLSLKAGGTGLTLTAANHVVHVDRWWNPAVEDQATDRAFRIGQRRAVQVRKFVCGGTIEEKIAALIREKRGLAARIVGSGEEWLTELSTAQLRELFRLEADSVVE
jgi:SNF2-related domain/SNF2 Helicase protein/Helicase conserved C-terminal domain